MKLVISKNKDGNYYTKLVNKYNNEESEMYLNIQLGKSVGELEYGLYEVDGFLSCYNSKDGSVKPKLVITSAKPTTKYEKKEEKNINEEIHENDTFTEYGDMVEVDDTFLD